MFSIGDLIIYGNNGVCQVMGVSAPHLLGAQDERLYYELKPYQKDGRIMTPVENAKIPMRPILNEEEATQLIEEIPSIGMLLIENDKVRETTYKECIRSADCRQWISIIKTLYNRRQERLRQGKRMTATDERYLKQAEDYLYSELSIPLGVPKDKVETYITTNIENRNASLATESA